MESQDDRPQEQGQRSETPATPPDQHHLKATLSSLGTRQTYFVDWVLLAGFLSWLTLGQGHAKANIVQLGPRTVRTPERRPVVGRRGVPNAAAEHAR